MVPEGWTRRSFGELFDFKNGYNTEKSDYGSGTPFINVSEVLKNEALHVEQIPGLVRVAEAQLAAFGVRRGDILFNRTSETPDEVGFTTVYLDTATVIFGGFVIRARPLTSELVPEFCQYAFRQPDVREQIIRRSQGAIRSNIGQGELSQVSVALPPLHEQQKIAEILSTWDKAIQTTEALLANARTQKRALMQSLLTGTRRFPGFEDHPWREVRLQQIADIIVSNVDKKSELDELPVRLCNYTDVYKNDTIRADMDFMEATATPAQIKKFGLKVGDVIITKDSEDPSDIAVPAYVAETAADLVCGYHLAIIRANDHADGRFLKYCFELPHTRYYFGARANGATRFGLNIDSIETAAFRVPSVSEQRVIADAIQMVENEIGQTISMLDHLRTEKKSLMQQLLTGKRRVAV